MKVLQLCLGREGVTELSDFLSLEQSMEVCYDLSLRPVPQIACEETPP